jgi:hypothetical protein
MTDQSGPRAPRSERAERVALFRYTLIREAADPALSPRRRGALVRALAAGEHTGAGRPTGAGVPGERGPLDPRLRDRRLPGAAFFQGDLLERLVLILIDVKGVALFHDAFGRSGGAPSRGYG